MPKLTILRQTARDAIRFNVIVVHGSHTRGAQIAALFDTGNDHTLISRALAESIGIVPSGKELPVRGVTGGSMAHTALVDIWIEFDAGSKVTIENHEVAILDGMSDHVLIGRDFLEQFDVTISRDGSFTLER